MRRVSGEATQRRTARAEEGQAAVLPAGLGVARALFEDAVFGIIQLGLDGHVLTANQAALQQLGYTLDELRGKPFAALLSAEDQPTAAATFDALVGGTKKASRHELRYRRKDGTLGWARLTAQLTAERPAEGASIIVMAEEDSDRMRREALERGERAALERIARGDALNGTLEAIAALVESQAPGMLASILLVDDQGRVHVGAGRSLPAAYNQAVEGEPIGPQAGSCGTAAYRRETVITPDIATDPLWERYRSVALAAGLASSWSTPLFASDGRVIGTLAQYYHLRQDPSPRDLKLVEAAKHLAEIAIESKLAYAALREARDNLEERVAARTTALREAADRLQASERLQSAAQSIAHMGSWEWDMATNVVRWSDELYRIYGLTPQSFGATFEAFLAQIREDEREMVRATVERSAATHAPFTIVQRIVRPSGEERTLASNGRVDVDAEGRAVRMWGTCLDITERSQAEAALKRLYADLERRVAERTLQLEETNHELEAFSYSVSHDLRAPLRAIDGFSKILLAEHEAGLDEVGKNYLRRVRAATQRMDQLIDEMLALSRLTRGELHLETVDLSALAREVATDLRAGAPARKIDFEIAEGLSARGDPRLLRTVLENLLGNAVKFTGRHPRAHITFGARDTERGRAFFVRDDGAGFDMGYVDQLFKPFSRLHDQDEFTGSGIGLASVQRIVHRHGGHIWAESEPERGATFSFTLGGLER